MSSRWCVWSGPTSCCTPSMRIWNPSVPMMQENTMIPSGCMRDFPAGNRYLFCFRIDASVRHRMRPLTRSRNESSALVMMESDPELYAAKTFMHSRATFAQNETRNANASRRARFASFASSALVAASSRSENAASRPSSPLAPFCSSRSSRFSISAKFSTSWFCFR